MEIEFLASNLQAATAWTGKTLGKFLGVLNQHDVISVLGEAHYRIIGGAGSDAVRDYAISAVLQLVDPTGYVKFTFEAFNLLRRNTRIFQA